MTQGQSGFNFQTSISGNQAGSMGGVQGGQANANAASLLNFMAGIASTNARSANFIGQAMQSAGESYLRGKIAAGQRQVYEDQLAFKKDQAAQERELTEGVGKLLSSSQKAADSGSLEDINAFYELRDNNPTWLGAFSPSQLKQLVATEERIDSTMANSFLNKTDIARSINYATETGDLPKNISGISTALSGANNGQVLFDTTRQIPNEDGKTFKTINEKVAVNLNPETIKEFNSLPKRIRANILANLEKNVLGDKQATLKVEQAELDIANTKSTMLDRAQKTALNALSKKSQIRQEDKRIDISQQNADTMVYNAQTNRFSANENAKARYLSAQQKLSENGQPKPLSKNSPQDVQLAGQATNAEVMNKLGEVPAVLIANQVQLPIPQGIDAVQLGTLQTQYAQATDDFFKAYLTEYGTGKTNDSFSNWLENNWLKQNKMKKKSDFTKLQPITGISGWGGRSVPTLDADGVASYLSTNLRTNAELRNILNATAASMRSKLGK